MTSSAIKLLCNCWWLASSSQDVIYFLCLCKESNKESTADFPACVPPVPPAGRDAEYFLCCTSPRPKSALTAELPRTLSVGQLARENESLPLKTRCRVRQCFLSPIPSPPVERGGIACDAGERKFSSAFIFRLSKKILRSQNSKRKM